MFLNYKIIKFALLNGKTLKLFPRWPFSRQCKGTVQCIMCNRVYTQIKFHIYTHPCIIIDDLFTLVPVPAKHDTF